jgi:PDZ domain
VRRNPDIKTENIIYWLESIRPAVPVFRLCWNPEWPTRTLPWVILFDHEGREVFAGKPERIEAEIEKTLAAAPDHMIGGPYDKQKALAETIVADRAGLGNHLARLRDIEDPDPEQNAMIAAAEGWFERQVTRIDEDMPGPVEREQAWDALAKTYAGDRLGERAAKERDTLRSMPTFVAEKAAAKALGRARATLRRCPPHGGYFPYHFTKINYTVIDDPAWVAARVRTLVELRIELEKIVATWPDTFAAEEAGELLFLHDVPDIPVEAARERIARAEQWAEAACRPAELYEAWLNLLEVREGYLGSDDLSARADELLSSIRKNRATELLAAAAEAAALREEAELLKREALLGGSLLPRKKADEIMARLGDVAKRSGEDTVLARRIAAYVAELAGSFEGRPLVGVRFDAAFKGPGARLVTVDAGTGAAKAGLAPGDVVLKVGETALASHLDFVKALAGKGPGETITVEALRASGETEVLELTLGRRPRRR